VPAQGAPSGGQPQYDPPAYYYEEVHRSDTWKRTALMLIGLAALLSILGFLVVRFYEELGLGDDSPVEVVSDGAPTLVEVPDLTGLGLLEAENRVRELGLGIDLSYRVNTGVPENTVFSQVPPAGQRLEAGEVVSVTVSQGEIPRVPPVTGRNSNDARMILESSGYVVIEVKETNQAEAGIVVRQQPDSRTELIPGEAVTITVSTGPGQIFVPDVRGKTPIEAFRVLNGLGFTPKERYESSETIPEGAVIETEPIVGTPMSPQSQIIVIISDGLPVVAVPDVRGLLFDTGRLTLERSGLVVGTVTFESVDPGSPDISRILEQAPPPNQETQQGTIVNLVVGAPAEPEPEPAPDPEPDPTETTAPSESTTTVDPPAAS